MNAAQCWRSFIAGRTVSVLVFLMSSARLVLAEPAADVSSPGETFADVDTYLERQFESLNIPGAALAIVEGGEIVHLRGFGAARPDGESPSPRTPFLIGSLTKSVTALAVMQLVEAGRIELDAPVRRYLPWFKVAEPQASAQITVRHLLNQTGGLPQAAGMRLLADFDDSPGATERQARALSTLVPARPVGSAFEYSNINYNLLGLIVETASGERYADYVQNHIFAPLGMSHSHTSRSAAVQDGLAVGHRFWFGTPVAAPDLPLPGGSLPSGQILSSAEDMARYLIAHLNEGRYGDVQILSPEGIAELHRPAVHVVTMAGAMGDYGMGWFVEDTDQGRRIWHHGTVPDFFAYMVLLPEQKRGMVFLANGNHMASNFALLDVGTAAASLLAGIQPGSTSLGVVPWALRGFLLIPLLQFIGILATLRLVRRWRREPRRRPGSVKKWVLHILLPALPHLVLALSALGMLAGGLFKFIQLFLPDITWLVLACGGIALVWVFLRTWLVLSTLRTPAGNPAPARMEQTSTAH